LGDAVLDPIKTYVHGFGAALLDCVIVDAQCARIVSLYSWVLEGVRVRAV
jgi:hypothetical protein